MFRKPVVSGRKTLERKLGGTVPAALSNAMGWAHTVHRSAGSPALFPDRSVVLQHSVYMVGFTTSSQGGTKCGHRPRDTFHRSPKHSLSENTYNELWCQSYMCSEFRPLCVSNTTELSLPCVPKLHPWTTNPEFDTLPSRSLCNLHCQRKGAGWCGSPGPRSTHFFTTLQTMDGWMDGPGHNNTTPPLPSQRSRAILYSYIKSIKTDGKKTKCHQK